MVCRFLQITRPDTDTITIPDHDTITRHDTDNITRPDTDTITEETILGKNLNFADVKH